MNIALIPSAFHPSLGGVEELSRQLAHHLRDAGHYVSVSANRWPKDLPATETFEGLPLRRYIFRVPENTARQFAGALLYGRGTLKQFCNDLRHENAEILHAQCVSSNVHYALQAQTRLKVPFIVSLQGELTMDASHVFETSAFARNLMRRALRSADAITACSGHTLAEAEAFYGTLFGSRARVIHNGIRFADFQNVLPHSHPKPYILAIGRHVPQKGFDILLRAFAQSLKSAAPPSQDILIAGDGPENAALKQLSQDLGIASRTHFLGRTDRAQTAALFTGCDFFILPSRHEPQGIVVLEAMAAAKPVIATSVGGVPEIVRDHHNGILIPPADVDALAQSIQLLSSSPALRQTLSANARTHAQSFDWQHIATQYEEVYAAALHKTPQLTA